MLEPPTPGPFAGVPLGGIGAGCIGRGRLRHRWLSRAAHQTHLCFAGYRGEMRRWSIHAGRYIHREVLTNQFSIRVKRGADVRCVVLSVMDGAGADPLLRGWAWGVPAERVESHALFPRSWLVFRDALPGLTVIIEQISPVIPNCYSDTSLPTAVFDVSVDNTDPFTEAEVSVMMTIQNCDGTNDDPAGGYSHAPFAVHLPGGASAAGVCMARHRYTAPSGDPPVACDQGSMALAVLTLADADTGPACVTTCGLFSTNVAVDGLTSASNLWSAFEVNGDLTHCTASGTVGAGVAAASAVCKKIKINKQSHANFTFSLSWDHPMARFGGGKTLPKYYTRFFGRSGLASPSICAYSLLHFQRWRREIIDWQHPVNSDESLPAYYRHMLFNELYFLVDGGSIWLDSTDGVENTDSPLPPSCFQSDVLPEKCPCSFASLKAAVERQRDVVLDLADRSLWSGHDEAVRACVGNSEVVGQFLYLEGHEYLM